MLIRTVFTWVFTLIYCIGLLAQDNQNLEIDKLESGNFTVYKVEQKNYNTYKFEKASKPWPVEFKKSGTACSEVFIKRAGIIDETYTPDLPGYPAYFKGATDVVVTVLGKKIYYYSYSIKTGATIKYILSEKGTERYENEKQLLDDYRANMKTAQSETRTERIEEKEEAAAKLAEENTLKGKSIKSIRMKLLNNPTEIGLMTILNVGIEVELSDGKLLKTKNLGGHTPYTDFDSEVSGGEFAGGDFKVATDARKISGDKIEIKVWSKYAPNSVKGTLVQSLNYKNDIHFNLQGKWGTHGRSYTAGFSENGGNGTDGKTVSLSAELTTIHGEQVNHILLTDALSGSLIADVKLHVNNSLHLHVQGGNGGDGASGTSSGNGGDGGDAGNGGDVTITGSGAMKLQAIVNNQGGIGGKGGRGKESYHRNGLNGSNGSKGVLIK